MIFLLRKLRRLLLEKNKIKTYFLYAIGEIILVVIGILIAVRIDGWNETRKERKREAFLLEQINKEMKENLRQYETVMELMIGTVSAGDSLVAMFPLTGKVFTDDSLSARFSKLFPAFLLNPSFDPSSGTLKSVISSGDLNLIQNEELRMLIVTWEDVFNDYKEEEMIAWKYGYSFMDWMTIEFPNPMYVELDIDKMNFRGVQSKISEKLSMYSYSSKEEENQKMKSHMERMVTLTENAESK